MKNKGNMLRCMWFRADVEIPKDYFADRHVNKLIIVMKLNTPFDG